MEFLQGYYLSKTKIYTLFLEKRIKKNNVDCKREDALVLGDVVSVIEEESIDFICENKRLGILYEDDYLLIVNKPAGMLVHPDSKDKTGSLCNVVAGYYRNKGYDLSVKYAHRLDMETTGILIFCKDMLTMAYMNHCISTHEVKRYYRLFVGGRLKNSSGTIDLPIGEDRHHGSRRRVSKTGQPAVTHYRVLREFKEYSYVEARLETGRTHQIRVHFSHINHPLLGDELYHGDSKNIKRVALHSYKVEFNHPVTGKLVSIVRDLPYDMRALLGGEYDYREACK